MKAMGCVGLSSLGSTALKKLQACKTRNAKVFPSPEHAGESPAGRAAKMPCVFCITCLSPCAGRDPRASR